MINRRQFQLGSLPVLVTSRWSNISFDGSLSAVRSSILKNDWPQWGGPNRNFRFSVPGRGSHISRPQLLWEHSLGKGHSAVVSDGEFVYSQHLDGEREVITKWRLADGDVQWSYRYKIGFHSFNADYDGPHSTPAVSNNCLITVGIDARVHAIELANGEPRWQRELRESCGTRLPQSGYASSPLVWNDRVILPTIGESTNEETEEFDPDPNVPSGRSVIPGAVSLDLATGQEVWRTDTFRTSHSSPIQVEVNNQPMIVFHTMFELIGVDPSDGTILWRQLLRRAAADNVSFTPVWDEDRRQFLICHGYCNSGAQAIRLHRENRRWKTRVAWTNSRMRIVHTNGVVSGTTLIGTNREPATLLVGVDIRDGRTLYRKRGYGKSNLLVSDEQLLMLDESGDLVSGQLGEYGIKEQWRIPALNANAWTVPSIAGKHLLLRDGRQIKVYRFGT